MEISNLTFRDIIRKRREENELPFSTISESRAEKSDGYLLKLFFAINYHTVMKISAPIILCFILALSAVNSMAQDKHDTLIMLNGDKKEGKVIAINPETIKFKYSGEDLEYEIKKEEINKIVFGSGREEVLNEETSAASAASNPGSRKNKMAVLPFEYITNDPSIMVDAMRIEIQSSCINSFRREAKSLDVQDPMTTNALLAKNEITHENYKTIPPKDMAILLGVEYVVYGTFDLENEGTRTYGSTVTTYKEKEDKKGTSYNNNNKKSSGTAVSSSSSSTSNSYDAKVVMSIYSDTGKTIYNDSRKPFSADPDAYKSAIDYMVKRTPFGSKYK